MIVVLFRYCLELFHPGSKIWVILSYYSQCVGFPQLKKNYVQFCDKIKLMWLITVGKEYRCSWNLDNSWTLFICGTVCIMCNTSILYTYLLQGKVLIYFYTHKPTCQYHTTKICTSWNKIKNTRKQTLTWRYWLFTYIKKCSYLYSKWASCMLWERIPYYDLSCLLQSGLDFPRAQYRENIRLDFILQ